MPQYAKNYSTTEPELCGLAIYMVGFKHLLKKQDFDALVYPLALIYLLKSKIETPTSRVKRL